MTADSRNRWSKPTPRMRDVAHVHPEHDPRAWHWFARGPVIAADGGKPDADPDTDRSRDVEDEQLRDVSHQAKHGEGANRVWDRGEEGEEDG